MTNAQSVKPKKAKSQKIRVKFERTSFFTRFRLKYLNGNFWKNVVFVLFRLILLLGISYVILFPFFAKISASFMTPADFVDPTVKLIPKYPSIETYQNIIKYNHYFKALFNTAVLSVLTALLQTDRKSVV